jgi:hypothetical protein
MTMRRQTPLPEGYDRFVKVCGMLGSDHVGERAAAALKATAILREQELTWDELLSGFADMVIAPPHPTPGQPRWTYDPSRWREVAVRASRGAVFLNEWEMKFVGDILPRESLTREAAPHARAHRRVAPAQGG